MGEAVASSVSRSRFCEALARALGQSRYEMFFSRKVSFEIHCGAIEGKPPSRNRLTFNIPDDFIRNWLQREYQPLLEKLARECLDGGIVAWDGHLAPQTAPALPTSSLVDTTNHIAASLEKSTEPPKSQPVDGEHREEGVTVPTDLKRETKGPTIPTPVVASPQDSAAAPPHPETPSRHVSPSRRSLVKRRFIGLHKLSMNPPAHPIADTSCDASVPKLETNSPVAHAQVTVSAVPASPAAMSPLPIVSISDTPSETETPATLLWRPEASPQVSRVAGPRGGRATSAAQLKSASTDNTSHGNTPYNSAAFNNATESSPGNKGRHSNAKMTRRPLELTDLVAGSCNELAIAAAKKVCEEVPAPFNPLYLFGNVGIGKTHLLEGIARQLRRQHPHLTVLMMTAEQFANCFTQALRDKTLPSFRQKFRNVDALLIDDVDFLDNTRVIREEFLHTFTELAERGRAIVLTADRHPKLLTKLGDELVTRFMSGLICRLETPDAQTRERIVQQKAARMGTDISPEALTWVAQKFRNNVRELEGALNCLHTWYTMSERRVGLATARQILADLERDCLKIVRLTDIEQTICTLFGVKPRELKSASRARTVSQPRMLAMFLARKHTQSAYQEIGQHFGGRNHSTVMAAEKKVHEWIGADCQLHLGGRDWNIREVLDTLEQQLMAG